MLVAWGLLAAALCDLLDTQLRVKPAVLAVAAAVLVGVGTLLAAAVAADRRRADHRLARELRRASAMLRSIEAVTDPGLAFLDLDDLLATVLGRTEEALGADVVAVLLADADGSTLRVRASSGATELAPVGGEVPADEGVLGAVTPWARTVVVPDVAASGLGALPEWQRDVASLMVAPLVVLGTSIGAIEVASRAQRTFDAAERRLLQVVADHVAAVVERARLDELATRGWFGVDHANLQLRLLARGGTALGKALDDYHDAMEELADVVVPDFADWFGVHVLDDAGALREVVQRAAPAAFPRRAGSSASHPHPKGDALVRSAMALHRPQVLMPTSRLTEEAIGATLHTHESLGEAPDVSSMLVVPVEVRGACMASLTFVTGPERRGYRPSDLETGRELAERVGVAIERVHSWQAAQRAGEVAARDAERLRQLVEVSLVVNAQFSEEEVLELLVEHTRRALSADAVVVRALSGPSPRAEMEWPAPGTEIPRGLDGVEIAAALEAGAAAVAHSANVARSAAVAHSANVARGLAERDVGSADARADTTGSAPTFGGELLPRGWIAAPITDASGAVHRAVVAVGAPGATYSLEDESVLTVLAQMASVALRNARLYGEVLENEQRLETVVDSSPLAIAELRPSGEAQWWNRAAAALFDWPDRSAPRRIPVRPGSELVIAGLIDSSFNGRPITGVALPITGSGGQPLELSVSASPLGPAGAVSSVLVVAEDVTARQRMLEQLHQAERLQAMSRMAGALAHDFNNLLTVILGCGDSLMHRIGDDEDLGPDVAAIHRAGTRAAALTSQLLRIGGQRPAVEPELVRLDEVITAMEPILAGALGEHSRLRISAAAGESIVRIDPAELERCLLNLVINARDAMPDGGTCTVRSARILAPDGLRGSELVALSVSDDGTGMDDETAAHCFEPFFTTKGRARGTGLGLAAVHAMVSQAGGDVRVATSRGEGTTFTITLPVVADVAGPTASGPARDGGVAGAPNRSGRLLVVDDEPEVRRLVVRQLEAAGYEALAAANAGDALQLLASHGPIDLLVTDVVMPGMNGIELANAVRLSFPGMKVLLVSGHLDDESRAMGSRLGNAVIVTKPFSSDELARAVRTLLGPSRPRP